MRANITNRKNIGNKVFFLNYNQYEVYFMKKQKQKQIISAIIVLILVIAMVVPMVVSLL